MNTAYRIIWSESVGTWVPVPEYARSKGKPARAGRALRRALAIAAASLCMGGVQAADLADLQIVGDSDNTPGLDLQGPGDVVRMYEQSGANTGKSGITTTGRASPGARVADGASLTLDHSNIATGGRDATGIEASGAGTQVSMAGSELKTAAGIGASVAGGASLSLEQSRFSTAYAGVTVDGAGSLATLADSAISTTGYGAHGVGISGGGKAILADTTITTAGGTAHGIHADGAGSQAVMTGGAIAAGGIALSAQNGATIHVTGSTIDGGRHANAVRSMGSGSRITLDDVKVGQSASSMPAMLVGEGAGLAMKGGSIAAGGNNAIGIMVARNPSSGPASVDIEGARIEIARDARSGYGVQVDGHAVVNLKQAGIVTRGDYGAGVWQTTALATTTLTGTTVHTFGLNAAGVVGYGGLIRMDGGSVTTEGQSAHGLYAADNTGVAGAHAVVEANGVSVLAKGDGYGAVVLQGAEMAITGGDVTAQGNGVAAVLANGRGVPGTRLALDGTRLLATGNGSHGIYASNAAQVSASGVAVQVRGQGGYGLFAANAPRVALANATVRSELGGGLISLATAPGMRSAIDVAGSTVEAPGGIALAAVGGSAGFDLSHSRVDGAMLMHVGDTVLTDAGGNVVDTIAAGTIDVNARNNTYLSGAGGVRVDSGTLNLNLERSALAGDIRVTGTGAAPAVANLSLSTGSLFAGAASGAGQVTVDGSSAWQVTGDSAVAGIASAGTVAFAPAGGFKTLTAGSYAGGTGGGSGTLVMNAALGGDDSPADRLVIDAGRASGSTAVLVNNAGGQGAQTADGILLVEAVRGGATDAGAFHLARDVRAGAYDYRLFRGGPRGESAQAENWYLRSTFEFGGIEQPDESGSTPPGEAKPPPHAILGPELSVYGAAMPTAARVGQLTLGTLHERVGEQENLRADGTAAGKVRNGHWGRLFGSAYKDRYGGLGNPATSATIAGFQVGADLYHDQRGDGRRDHAGLYIGVAHASGGVDGTVTNAGSTAYVRERTGRLKVDGASAGAYWTHYGAAGWYGDAVLQLTSYSGTASTSRTAIGVDGHGVVASLEGGYPLQPRPGWSLEPQAQLIYQRIKLNNAADAFSTVGLGTSNSVLARLGARLQFTGRQGDKLLQPYARANLWSTLSGARNTVDYGGVDQIQTRAGGHWGQLGLGITAKIGKQASVFGNVDGLFPLEGGEKSHAGVQGVVGFRMNW
ncbi:autotransporter outer membrane beta-barrel domain-containing protein [Cupriavidus sp. 30B13]|uniref:autotransporter outer membrane beta-barrel domain-containing protein n=1 Tax=Cupriavidus sp. 30B13 TaxID=3384241 RepID=UPI003B90CAC0